MLENAATATRVDAFKGEEFGSGIRCVSSLPPRREAADQPQELPVSMANVIGQSESLVEVYRVVDRIAATDCTPGPVTNHWRSPIAAATRSSSRFSASM